jgi:hypothetical protein
VVVGADFRDRLSVREIGKSEAKRLEHDRPLIHYLDNYDIARIARVVTPRIGCGAELKVRVGAAVLTKTLSEIDVCARSPGINRVNCSLYCTRRDCVEIRE